MKNCLVLSGQFRSFDRTFGSIKQFIDNNQLDVYGHMWSTDQNEIDFVTDKLKTKNIVFQNTDLYADTFSAIEERILKNNPKISILFTTTTKTSAAIIANKIKDWQGRVTHQFFPTNRNVTHL